MAGIDWAALPIVCGVLGVHDPALVISGLTYVRDHFEAKDRARLELARLNRGV